MATHKFKRASCKITMNFSGIGDRVPYHKVAIKVISQKGTCQQEHRVGEEWEMYDKTLEGICLGAFLAILPQAPVLMFEGSFPFSDAPDTEKVACPDGKNPVIFEIRRL
jgi:uncharacterized repeat protein (TIGR04076 family)